MADKTFTLDSGTTKGKFVDIGSDLFAKADVPLVKTASGLYLPFPLTDDGYYPAILQAGSAIVGKVGLDPANNSVQVSGSIPAGTNLMGKMGIDQTTPGTTNGVAITSSIESVADTPVVGAKTVTATAAEIFAGASIKASRRKLIIRNEDPVLRLRIGPSTVTQQNGFPVEPGASVKIQFDPATAVPIYGISEGAALSVAVMEV